MLFLSTVLSRSSFPEDAAVGAILLVDVATIRSIVVGRKKDPSRLTVQTIHLASLLLLLIASIPHPLSPLSLLAILIFLLQGTSQFPTFLLPLFALTPSSSSPWSIFLLQGSKTSDTSSSSSSSENREEAREREGGMRSQLGNLQLPSPSLRTSGPSSRAPKIPLPLTFSLSRSLFRTLDTQGN